MRRVLFVDDEPKILEGLRRMLYSLRREWRMDFAEGGREALDRLAVVPYDVVVTDIRMPGMDGLEVLRRIREFDREAGVIMVTAVKEETIGRQALRMGACDFVTKPIDLDYLEKSIWCKIAEMTI